jgi:hypothetical protein
VVPYTERFPPDVEAAKFILTNREPDLWSNKQTIEHSVADKLAERLESARLRTLERLQALTFDGMVGRSMYGYDRRVSRRAAEPLGMRRYRTPRNPSRSAIEAGWGLRKSKGGGIRYARKPDPAPGIGWCCCKNFCEPKRRDGAPGCAGVVETDRLRSGRKIATRWPAANAPARCHRLRRQIGAAHVTQALHPE